MRNAFPQRLKKKGCTLAGVPPLELEAIYYEEVYERVSNLRGRGTSIQNNELDTIKESSRRKLVRNWGEWIKEMTQEGDTILGVIGGQLREWLNAEVGLSFRMTQVLTGHGCFWRFLCRIGREASNRCWHCDALNDSAGHTLRYCPAWEVERAELRGVIGLDLSLKAVIKLIRREEGKQKFHSFCERVMSRKEAAERDREGVNPMT
ncbi:PREDICTED: uncharacterized protein LOC108769210 [Trachymyrmex cornetzi]|uniref:uncharacterized protein LOC108769210 n=1 Tax=Trachymyrmex cornetzi TaxID=471704 RepID=UPI00084F8358|nr:PREDICTED: uncharacterized protein LOC108769210 [Trachymyrmex cornetzi]